MNLHTLIVFLLLLSLPTGSWWFLFRPMNSQQESLKADISAKQTRMGELSNTIAKTRNMSEEIAKLDKAIGFLEKKLPSEDEIQKVGSVLADISRKAGISQPSVLPAAPVSMPTYREQEVRLTEMKGTFYALLAFLQRLETMDRITRVKELNITKDSAQLGYLNVDMTLVIYFEKSSTIK
ncbi:MAG: type 4a pilus biogenesis protein PilO [Phycisphaerae bacterium]